MSFFFFFFKQKTAYEMRISDWSSDVCSSDLTTLSKACWRGSSTTTSPGLSPRHWARCFDVQIEAGTDREVPVGRSRYVQYTSPFHDSLLRRPPVSPHSIQHLFESSCTDLANPNVECSSRCRSFRVAQIIWSRAYSQRLRKERVRTNRY